MIIRRRLLCSVCAALLLGVAPAAAQLALPDSAAPAPERWDVSAELSYADQSGNETLRLFTGGLRVSHREKEAFELEGVLQSRYGESQNRVVARNHYGSLTFDLHPQRRWSPFLFATLERDAFKRLDLRANGGAGAKLTPYRADGGDDEASVSLALLVSHENLAPTATDATAPVRTLARWSLRVRGARELRPGIDLRHTTFYQPAWDRVADYLLRSDTEATVLLTERLALSVSYQLNRNGLPPAGVQPEDRLFKTGLIIDL